MRASRRSACRALGVLVAFAASSPAIAEPSPGEVSIAQRLFDEGVALKQRGSLVEACTKLAESQRLDPGLGTQYHLADCWEKQGRTASAWLLFQEIAKQAAVSGQKERERVARERADELSPRVPRLLIAVPVTSDVAGLAILRDGELVARSNWNTALPVDPGAHDIVARAPARTWQTSTTLDARARTQTVLVPNLDAHGSAQRVALGEVTRDDKPADARRIVGIGAAAAGVVGLGAGTFFLVKAGGESATAEQLGCSERTCPTSEGVDARSRAVVAGNVATAAFAVGAVAAGAGLYLLLTSPSSDKPHAYAAASASGIRFGGSF